MRRIAVVVALVAMVLGAAASAHAAPPGQTLTVDCDNGQSYELNFGAGPNQGSVAFVVGTHDEYVAKHYEIVVDGVIVYSFDRGINGFEGQTLMNCSGQDPESGVVFNSTGFITPR